MGSAQSAPIDVAACHDMAIFRIDTVNIDKNRYTSFSSKPSKILAGQKHHGKNSGVCLDV